MNIGRRIFYNKLTGEVIFDTGERVGCVVPTTPEQDIQTYKELEKYNTEILAWIDLEYGQYKQDFIECNGYRINIEKLEKLTEDRKHEAIEFSYPNSKEEEKEEPKIVYRKPLSVEVENLKQSIAELTILLAGGEN